VRLPVQLQRAMAAEAEAAREARAKVSTYISREVRAYESAKNRAQVCASTARRARAKVQ
jgi:hypothetical protein